MPWLISRIQQKESPVSQNKQYAAEILAIILQSSPKNRKKFSSSDGVDVLLQLLSAYRKRDPEKDSDEEEYVENLFDCLTCIVDEEEGKEKFLEAEGLELAQIMLREGKLSKQRALRVLDHALSGPTGIASCERLVEIAGLRTIFGMFMKKVSRYLFSWHCFKCMLVIPNNLCSKKQKLLSIYWASLPRFYGFYPEDLRRGYELLPSSWRKTTRKSTSYCLFGESTLLG